MAHAPVFLRPWWFNLFEAIGVMWMLVKTHSIKIMCDSLTEKKNYFDKTDKFFMVLSFSFGLLRLICFVYLTVHKNFSKEIFTLSERFLFEVYLSRFAVTFYQFFIIVIPLIGMYKKIIDKNVPIVIRTIFAELFFYCLIPKLFLDNLQTSTLNFIKFLLGDGEITFSSPDITQAISVISVYFFYIMYKTVKRLNKIEKNEFLLCKKNHFFDIKFTLEPQHMRLLEHSETPIFDTIHNSMKKSIGNFLDINENKIIIEHNELYPASIYTLIQEKKEIVNYLVTCGVMSIDEINAYEFIYGSTRFIVIKNFLEEFDLKMIIPICEENNLIGIIAIKSLKNLQYERCFDEYDISYIYNMSYHLIEFKKNIKEKSFHNIINFKIKSINQHIDHLLVIQDQMIKNISSLVEQGSFGMYLKEKKKYICFDNNIKESNIIEDLIEIMINDNDKNIINKKKLYINSGKETTFLAQKIPEFKKNLSVIPFFSFPLLSSYKNKSYIAFELTEFGKKINLLFPGVYDELMSFKNNILMIANNPKPFLFIGPLEHFEILLKIVSYIKNFDIFYCDILKEQDMSFFDLNLYKNIDSKNECIVAIPLCDRAEKKIQRHIVEHYISHELSHKRFFKNTLFFHTLTIDSATNCDEFLYKICLIKEIYTMPASFILKNKPHEIIESVALFLYKKEISYNQSHEIMEEITRTVKESSTIYDIIRIIGTLVEHLDDVSNISNDMSNYENSIIQDAISLGKKALKNKNIMKALYTIYNGNMTHIGNVIGVHKSTVSRVFKKII
jgi:hypothetical protein